MAQLKPETAVAILTDHGHAAKVNFPSEDTVMAQLISRMPDGSWIYTWEQVPCDLDSLRNWLGY